MNSNTLFSFSEHLNHDCFCFSLDRAALDQALDAELGQPGLAALTRERCPTVFAAQPVFVAPTHLRQMAQVAAAIEAVAGMPAYREVVLGAAPEIARFDPGNMKGVFFGYDFHLDHGRLGLIEINTNAGGAMLNAVLSRAQRSCCDLMDGMLPTREALRTFEQRMVDMFRQEWQLFAGPGNTRPLSCIAIVDEEPAGQYLYPEFLLFQKMFERHGIKALIAGPEALIWKDQALWHGGTRIDLVYNRLTDFYLENPASSALKSAYLNRQVALTPNPRVHALYADKSLLALFSDESRLNALGVPRDTVRLLLDSVPHTERVRADQGERLWAGRKHLFFKPVSGFGSRAAYRGDKLTRRVWEEILAGDYVAQTIVPPGERLLEGDDAPRVMKFDLRAYSYAGQVQWFAARLYQGQTTNFRTPGGGFSPVFSSEGTSDPTECACESS